MATELNELLGCDQDFDQEVSTFFGCIDKDSYDEPPAPASSTPAAPSAPISFTPVYTTADFDKAFWRETSQAATPRAKGHLLNPYSRDCLD